MSDIPFIRVPATNFFPDWFKPPEILLYSWLLNRAKLNGHHTLIVFTSVKTMSGAARSSITRTYKALRVLEGEEFIKVRVNEKALGTKGGRMVINVLKDPFEKRNKKSRQAVTPTG